MAKIDELMATPTSTPPTARTADRILVVGDGDGDGRILEQGTHPDLVALGGRYAALRSSFATDHPAVGHA